MNLPLTSNTENSPELMEDEMSGSQDKSNLVQKIKTSLFKQERVRVQKIVRQMRQGGNFKSSLHNAVSAIQQELQASRVLIYRFENNQKGRAIAESMSSDYIPTQDEIIACNVFGRKQASEYSNKEFTVVGEGTTNQATPYQQKLLDNFQVRSSLALPIFANSHKASGNKVWGLLVAQQCDAPRQWLEEEINLLERICAELSLTLQPTQPLVSLGQQQNVLGKVERDVRQLMRETLPQIRQSFQADRVWIYGFNPDWSGKVLSESVDPQWGSAAASFDNDCFLTVENYKPYYVVNDIYAQGFAPCLIEGLEAQQAKAYIAVPIVADEQLLGILAIFQNSSTRNWQESEVKRARDYAAKFSSPLQQLAFILHSKFQAKQVEKFSQQNFLTTIDREARKSLQKRLQQIRQLMGADRVWIYGFNPDWSGEVLFESVDSQWKSAATSFDNDCFLTGDNYQPCYVVNDIYAQDFSPCLIEGLEAQQAKAYIAVPIVAEGQLLGIFAIFQNSTTRNWQEAEIQQAKKCAVEFSSPLQQLTFIRHAKFQAKQIEKFSQQNFLTTINQEARQSMQKMVHQIRQLVQGDRVLVYGYNPDGSGEILVESFDSQWKQAGTSFNRDFQLKQDCQSYYVVDDIYSQKFARCYIEQLEAMEAKAYISVPIRYNEQLLGILSVFQNSGSRNWQKSEVELMVQYAGQFSVPLQQTTHMRHTQFRLKQNEKFLETERGLTRMLERIRSAKHKENVFQIATQEGRKLMDVDRLAIYRFDPDWSGRFIAESVNAGWSKLIDTILVVQDTFLQETQGGRYKHGECFVVDDIYTIGHQDCHIQLLEQFEARAYTIAPIFAANKKLWGLIAAYQNTGSRKWQKDEVEALRQIGLQVGIAMEQIEYVEQLESRTKELANSSARETSIIKFSGQLIERLAELSRENLKVNDILDFATKELRQVLTADRVVIYRFNPNWSGEFIVESVGKNWGKLVGTELAKLEETYFQESKGGRYSKKETLVINDIAEADRKDCHLELSDQFETQAYVIAPIFLENQLWGLLRVYQNDKPRHWKDSELAVIEQVGTQIGIILQLGKYVNQLRSQEQQLTEAADQERSKREQLQEGALRVLRALQPSFQGDLTVRAPLSEDAIGTIADGYNTTIQSLRELVRQVQISASRVSDTSGSNNRSVDELSDQAQQQVQRLEVALEELMSMVSSTEEVSSNAQKVEQALQEANKTVQNGDLLMEKTVDSILEMRDTVSETAKKIKRLGEASQRISKVVNLIDNFATQTNLLSLNAAIEATRAGEYGKGFAVVADEVRTLAYQSANATTEIERLVEEIQTEISEVTEVMEVGISQVVQGSELVDKTRHSLSEIVTVTNQISGLVEGITEATKIQNQQSQSLTEAMTDISTLANKTLASSTQISQSFQELRYTSEELQTSVSQFRVD